MSRARLRHIHVRGGSDSYSGSESAMTVTPSESKVLQSQLTGKALRPELTPAATVTGSVRHESRASGRRTAATTGDTDTMTVLSLFNRD